MGLADWTNTSAMPNGKSIGLDPDRVAVQTGPKVSRPSCSSGTTGDSFRLKLGGQVGLRYAVYGAKFQPNRFRL